jgi:hypothetical protein
MSYSIHTLVKRVIGVILLTGIIFSSRAQILDDSTRQLYGYHSVRYATETDVFYNRGLKTEVDSSLVSIQRYGYIYRNAQYSQDLGNWVTPIQCITLHLPSQTGLQTGFNVYSPFEYNANNIKYFDTKSPYAELKYYQGSRGQQSMEASFSRNINAQWNFGIDLRRIVSKKIIGYVTRNDKQAENYAFDFFVSHHSKNERYFLLASFNYMEAHNFENGGIKLDSVIDESNGQKRLADKYDMFNNQLSTVWLSNARSLDKRYNYRVYQHYDLVKGDKLQLFHRFDFSRKINRYTDNSLATNEPFYERFSAYTPAGAYDTVSIADRTDFNFMDNRAGVKGSSNKFFYAAFIKNRYVTMRQREYYDSISPYNRYTSEWYVDGILRRYFDEEGKSYAEASVDWGVLNHTNSLASPKDSTKNNYNASLSFVNKGFRLEGSTWAVSPGMIQSHYQSNLVSWDINFKQQYINRLFAEYSFRKKKIDVIPSLSWNEYNNYIYYTAAGTPTQYDSAAITHVQAKLGLRFNLWKIHVYNEFQYNSLDQGKYSKLQMPQVVNATQLFIEAWLFKKATLLQTGFDVLYRSSFQSNGYNPLIQQYYVTNYTGKGGMDFNYIDQYVVVDYFVNMQIRTARLFVKLANVKGLITPKKGYYTTPYYTGIPWTIDFGISWRFFD